MHHPPPLPSLSLLPGRLQRPLNSLRAIFRSYSLRGSAFLFDFFSRWVWDMVTVTLRASIINNKTYIQVTTTGVVVLMDTHDWKIRKNLLGLPKQPRASKLSRHSEQGIGPTKYGTGHGPGEPALEMFP
jgi:hypothetical protein